MERISALMDGELDQGDAARVLPDLKQREDLREAWSTYHLIGEALRGGTCGDCGVLQGVAARLATEPTVLAPPRPRSRPMVRYALPGMAAAAAMAAVTWIGLQQYAPPGAGGMIPAATIVDGRPGAVNNALYSVSDIIPGPQVAAGAPQIQLTTHEYQPYLMAHQPFSPSVAIQGLAPSTRAVSPGAER